MVGGADCKNSRGVLREAKVSGAWRSRQDASQQQERDVGTVCCDVCSFVNSSLKVSVCTFSCT